MNEILTFCLGERNIVTIIGTSLMNNEVKLNRGISAVIEILLHISILKPSNELHHTICLHNRSKVTLFCH